MSITPLTIYSKKSKWHRKRKKKQKIGQFLSESCFSNLRDKLLLFTMFDVNLSLYQKANELNLGLEYRQAAQTQRLSFV